MPELRAVVRASLSTPPTIRHRWRLFWIVWASGIVFAGLWALATPIGASPDEPAHIVKAASVVRGEFVGESVDGTSLVHVPQYVAWTHAQTCYAFKNTVSADCSAPVPEPTDEIVSSTTTAGLYNPVYYILVGWPSLIFTDSVGIYAMRIVSVVLSMLWVALSAFLIASWRRPALPLATLGVIVTPMVLFLAASVNPSAVESTATVAVLVAMLSILREPARHLLVERVVVLAGSAAIAVNARGLSPLWLAVVIIVPLFLVGRTRIRELVRERAVIVGIAGVGIATAFAGVWLYASNSLGRAISDPDGTIFPGAGTPPLVGFLQTFEGTPGFLSQMVGLFGWMDTPAPFATIIVWISAMVLIVVGALAVLRGRALWVFVVLLAAAIVLPPILQGAYITSGGYIWQGRYNLPLILSALLAGSAFLGDRLPVGHRSIRRVWGITVILLGVAHLYVFAVVLRRYVVGYDAWWVDFIRDPEWEAPGGNLVLVAVFALCLSVCGWFAWRAVLRVDDESPAPEHAEVLSRPNRE